MRRLSLLALFVALLAALVAAPVASARVPPLTRCQGIKVRAGYHPVGTPATSVPLAYIQTNVQWCWHFVITDPTGYPVVLRGHWINTYRWMTRLHRPIVSGVDVEGPGVLTWYKWDTPYRHRGTKIPPPLHHQDLGYTLFFHQAGTFTYETLNPDCGCGPESLFYGITVTLNQPNNDPNNKGRIHLRCNANGIPTNCWHKIYHVDPPPPV